MASPEKDDIHNLACKLAGMQLHVPNLKARFADWPTGINAHLDKLRPIVDDMIESAVSNEKQRNGLKRCDLSLLTALFFRPGVGWKEIQMIAAYMVWSAVWDDEIDEGKSEVATSQDKRSEFCEKSIRYAHRVLGLDTTDLLKNSKHEEPGPCMGVFRKWGDPLAESDDLAQRERVFRALDKFMSQAAADQDWQYDRKIPSMDEFITARLSIVGIGPVLVCADFLNGVQLPVWVLESKEMNIMMKETQMLLFIINDFYSLKKEMVLGKFSNIVAVMLHWNTSKSIHLIVNDILEMMDKSQNSFENAFKILDAKTKSDPKLNKDMKACADFNRTIITGNIAWSLMTERYRVYQYLQSDGSVDIPL